MRIALQQESAISGESASSGHVGDEEDDGEVACRRAHAVIFVLEILHTQATHVHPGVQASLMSKVVFTM
jgi:hypothetical protein